MVIRVQFLKNSKRISGFYIILIFRNSIGLQDLYFFYLD
jgi:hypothetical protein